MGEPVDFGVKFSYINEFFTFYESTVKPNGKYQLVFLCVKCQPLVRKIRSDSDSPLSNLRRHLINHHQDHVQSQFRDLLNLNCPINHHQYTEWKSIQKPRKPKKSSTKENLSDR